MKFTVVIATHRRAELLARALNSVQCQSFANSEVIVVSDIADAATQAVVSERLRPGDLFIQRSGAPGPAPSRNIGLKLATGDYVLFLDDDDTFREGFFEALSKQISLDSDERQTFFCDFEVVSESRASGQLQEVEVRVSDLRQISLDSVWVKNFIPNNCVVYPMAIASQIFFDASVPYEDWDYLLSACRLAPLKHLPIRGPRIHKNVDCDFVSRGVGNHNHLLDCYVRIYQKHSPPSETIAQERRHLFHGIGIDIDSLILSSSGR